MLTLPEKIIFIFSAVASLIITGFGVRRLIHIIGAGHGRPDWSLAWKRLAGVLVRMVSFQPVFRFRFWTSLLHAFVGWGFGFYILVNLLDLTRAFAASFVIPGMLGNIYRLLADIFSVGVLIGMFFFVIRRFVAGPANLSTRETTLIHPKARTGIRRDSAIVAGFIVLHVGSRFLGESLALMLQARADGWQPFASAMTGFWSGLDLHALIIGQHLAFWLALGSILAFLPYFPYSKHVHLFFAPLNYLLKPPRLSIGEMSYINLDDQSIEQFGAAKLADLGWEQLMDAYACIMCFRCQEVCPAYQTGKVLSPAALEVNKRYLLNSVRHLWQSKALQTGSPLPMDKLTDFAIPPEAVWACTACGACVDICPVGNEPMRDILDIRRNLVLMDNTFPKQFETVFRNLERTSNPWGVPASERMKWAEGLNIPTIEQNPEPDILWWVGCAPATDARAQKTAQAFARILEVTGVSYAVLGLSEQCTGDAARRAGREDIFFGLAQANVEILNEVNPKRIVTTCPHCLHTLKNEYPVFGGQYEVIHSTQFIGELIGRGKLPFQPTIENQQSSMVFHDPCYLGRQNGVIDEPREALKAAGIALKEMPHHAVKSFCCGAGGAQMWKEEQPGLVRLSEARLAEARATGAETLVVGCPFCLTMLNDAAKTEAGKITVVDIAEVLAGRLK